MVRLSWSVRGRLCSDHKELSVHEGPLGAAEQWDQALIWLSRCLPPRGPEPCVSTKIAQAHFPKHRDTITLTDGLFGCSALINTNDAPSFDWVSGFIIIGVAFEPLSVFQIQPQCWFNIDPHLAPLLVWQYLRHSEMNNCVPQRVLPLTWNLFRQPRRSKVNIRNILDLKK